MRRAGLALFAAGLLAGSTAGAVSTALADHEADMVAVDRAWYSKLVGQLLKDADELEEKNEDNPDKVSRKAIRERLVAMRKDLVSLRGDLEKAPPARVAAAAVDAPPAPPAVPAPTSAPAVAAVPPPPPQPVPMAPDAFGDLLAAIKKASYSSDKLALVKDVTSHAWFTTEQVVKVMHEFPYSNEKVQAAATMYPRVVDPQSWFKVYSALSYSSDREKLRKLTSDAK